MTGTMEFRWLAREEPPVLLNVLELRHRADEAVHTMWAGLPGPRVKVLAISRDIATDTGWLTATVDLVTEGDAALPRRSAPCRPLPDHGRGAPALDVYRGIMTDDSKVPDTVHMTPESDTVPLLSSPPPHRELHMFGNPIEPALSDEAWASVAAGNGLPYALGSSILDELVMLDGADIPAGIAYLNDRLPDSDPRKITREKVRVLRKLIDAMYGDENGGVLNRVYTSPRENSQLWALADALESYLPPEVA